MNQYTKLPYVCHSCGATIGPTSSGKMGMHLPNCPALGMPASEPTDEELDAIEARARSSHRTSNDDTLVLLTEVRRLRAVALRGAPAETPPETAWLIEYIGAVPTYVVLENHLRYRWTNDVNEATRFANHDEAERVRLDFFDNRQWRDHTRSAEHLWLPRAPLAIQPDASPPTVDEVKAFIARLPKPEGVAWYFLGTMLPPRERPMLDLTGEEDDEDEPAVASPPPAPQEAT